MSSPVDSARRRPSARDPETWFAAAYALLGERGPSGLTLPALCERVGATKGSFYYRFEDMPAFIAELAQRWQTWLVEYMDAHLLEADLRRRLELISATAYVSMTPAVQAMSAWARTSPAIAAAMPAPHSRAAALGAATFAGMCGDEDTGVVLGTASVSMCIGMQQRPRALDPDHFVRLVGRFYRGIGVDNDVVRVGRRAGLKVGSWQRMQPVTTAAAARVSAPATVSPPGREAGDRVWDQLIARGGTRSRYLAAAGELLAEQGADGLTVAALVARLGLTKGSFHHHFGSLPTFIEHLAAEWEDAQSHRIEAHLGERNPWRRLELLHADLLLAPHPADVAWRAWSHTHPVVGAAVRRVDEQREQALALTLCHMVDPLEAGLLAEMTAGLALGLHSWQPGLDCAMAERVAIEWMRRVLGVDAEIRTDTGQPRLALRRA